MKRILVADDRLDVVASIQEMLAPYFEVETATTGMHVLQLCEKHHFDGLIIDVEFPEGISGLETASRVRAANKEIKLLVFSATNYTDAVRQKVVDIGGVFCEKPLKLDFVRRFVED